MDKSLGDGQSSANTLIHDKIKHADQLTAVPINAAIQPDHVIHQRAPTEYTFQDDMSWQRQLAAGGAISALQWQQLTPQQQQQWRQQAKSRAEMDAQLYLAMQVPVPAQLADKILLAQSLALHNKQNITLGQQSAAALLTDIPSQLASMNSANRRTQVNKTMLDPMSNTTSDNTPSATVAAFKAKPPTASLRITARRFRWFNYGVATAASLVLLSGLWLSNIGWTLWPNQKNLASHTFAHIYHELDALTTTATIERAAVNQMLQDWQLTLRDDSLTPNLDQQDRQPYAVKYARFCDFAGVRSLHLVFHTPQGPITVFVLPRAHTLNGEYQFADTRFHGQRVLLAQGNHQMATDVVVVGAKAIPLAPIILQLQQQLKPLTA